MIRTRCTSCLAPVGIILRDSDFKRGELAVLCPECVEAYEEEDFPEEDDE